MSKILVADDSPTIQKVVAITLANQGFELTPANNANELVAKLKENSFDLILFDMGLAEGKNVKQFLQELKKFSNAPILGMYGTFDTVNDAEIQKIGLNDYIVKPFESDRFIEKCRQLIDSGSVTSGLSLMPDSSEQDNATAPAQADDEQWVLTEERSQVETPMEELKISIQEDVFDGPDQAKNLSHNLKDWGFSVPGIIGKGQSVGERPPVIVDQEETESEELQSPDHHEKTGPISLDMLSSGKIGGEIPEEESSVLPEDDDLAYPDLGPAPKPKSQLVPLETLSEDVEEDNDNDATDPGFSLQDAMKRTANLEMALEAESANDDFWAIDAGSVESAPAGGVEVSASANLEDFKHLEAKEKEFEFELGPVAKKGKAEKAAPSTPQYKPQPAVRPVAEKPGKELSPASKINEDELVEKLMAKILPALEARVEAKIKEIAERVAWEVIPDTAENMLRSELKEVVKTVYQELSDAH